MDQLIDIGLLLLGLLVVWVVLRFILRLAKRLFTLGCALLVVVGIILIYLSYWR
jgi:hypothetical protein